MSASFRKRARRNGPVHEPITDDELILQLGSVIPWMGEDPYPATLTKHPTRPVVGDLEYVRRILISWLIGRPLSEVAKRTGCSERTVRNVVTSVIHAREEDIEFAWQRWCELGLIGGIYRPDNQSGDAQQRYGESEDIVVVCQICHRVVGEIELFLPSAPEPGSALVDQEALMDESDLGERPGIRKAGYIQGHLMCHFQVGKDPIRKPIIDKWLRMRLYFGTATQKDKIYLAMRRRTQTVNQTALSAFRIYSEFVRRGRREILPIVSGKELSREAARRQWKKMIGVK